MCLNNYFQVTVLLSRLQQANKLQSETQIGLKVFTSFSGIHSSGSCMSPPPAGDRSVGKIFTSLDGISLRNRAVALNLGCARKHCCNNTFKIPCLWDLLREYSMFCGDLQARTKETSYMVGSIGPATIQDSWHPSLSLAMQTGGPMQYFISRKEIHLQKTSKKPKDLRC